MEEAHVPVLAQERGLKFCFFLFRLVGAYNVPICGGSGEEFEVSIAGGEMIHDTF